MRWWQGYLAFADPDDPATRPNQMRPLFLDRHTRELHRDWVDEAESAVASLRYVAGGIRAIARSPSSWGSCR